jgi:hypothetical protein
VIARKASASGRGVISAIVRRAIVLKVIAPRVTVRVPSVIVRTARRVLIVRMLIARTAIVPASSARKVIVPRVIVPTVTGRRATVRVPSAIVRTARRVVTALMAIVPRVTAPVRMAAPVASAAGAVPLSRL